jgi:hypothetical protein
MNFLTKLLTALILISPSITHATLFTIDSSNSIVHTTNWSNWPWDIGLPDDVVDLAVQGTFEVSITPGGINPFTGTQIPDGIAFANVNVISSDAFNRSWNFPSFPGFVFGTNFEGSSDPCFEFQYTSSGSCWSAGNFEQYQGSYDGHSISFMGTMNPDFFTGSNGYLYVITAVAVPEPEKNAYFIAGLSLILFRLKLKKNGRLLTKLAHS